MKKPQNVISTLLQSAHLRVSNAMDAVCMHFIAPNPPPYPAAFAANDWRKHRQLFDSVSERIDGGGKLEKSWVDSIAPQIATLAEDTREKAQSFSDDNTEAQLLVELSNAWAHCGCEIRKSTRKPTRRPAKAASKRKST